MSQDIAPSWLSSNRFCRALRLHSEHLLEGTSLVLLSFLILRHGGFVGAYSSLVSHRPLVVRPASVRRVLSASLMESLLARSNSNCEAHMYIYLSTKYVPDNESLPDKNTGHIGLVTLTRSSALCRFTEATYDQLRPEHLYRGCLPTIACYGRRLSLPRGSPNLILV